MKKYNLFLKNFCVFLSGEIFVVLLCSFFNLMGINTSITTLILFILNIFIFLFFGFTHGNRSLRKGFFTGFITGIILLIIMIFINFLFFESSFNINQLLYYLILILSSTLGGMFGKAKKKEDVIQQ